MKDSKSTLDNFAQKKVNVKIVRANNDDGTSPHKQENVHQLKADDKANVPGNLAAAFFTIICIMALLVVRGALFPHESNDFLYALRLWINEYKEMTFFEGLGTKVGVYNLPYM